MNPFVEIVTQLLKEQKISKNKMLKDLNLNRNSFVDWNKRGTIPNAKVVSAIAEYLGTTITTLMGYPEDEEKLTTFPMKLAYQITVNCTSVSDVAEYIHVPDETVMDWIKGVNNDYSNYYEQLSDFFQIKLRYWTSPGMISPGIEPDTDEYLLIQMYRNYKSTGIIDERAYGSIEYYFPDINTNSSNTLTPFDSEILSLFHQLPKKAQYEFRGEIKGYLKCLNEESVAEDETLRKTGTDNLGK